MGGSQKLRRSLWGRPRNSWRTVNASSSSSSAAVEGGSSTTAMAVASPLYYKLEAGNWTPKGSLANPGGQWEDIWVSENSLESKMARPIPMVVLTRIEDCPCSEDGASEEVSPAPVRSTQVSELFCSQCSYSCLNKPSLVNHFSARHQGALFSFKTVVLKCRVIKTACAKGDAPST